MSRPTHGNSASRRVVSPPPLFDLSGSEDEAPAPSKTTYRVIHHHPQPNASSGPSSRRPANEGTASGKRKVQGGSSSDEIQIERPVKKAPRNQTTENQGGSSARRLSQPGPRAASPDVIDLISDSDSNSPPHRAPASRQHQRSSRPAQPHSQSQSQSQREPASGSANSTAQEPMSPPDDTPRRPRPRPPPKRRERGSEGGLQIGREGERQQDREEQRPIPTQAGPSRLITGMEHRSLPQQVDRHGKRRRSPSPSISPPRRAPIAGPSRPKPQASTHVVTQGKAPVTSRPIPGASASTSGSRPPQTQAAARPPPIAIPHNIETSRPRHSPAEVPAPAAGIPQARANLSVLAHRPRRGRPPGRRNAGVSARGGAGGTRIVRPFREVEVIGSESEEDGGGDGSGSEGGFGMDMDVDVEEEDGTVQPSRFQAGGSNATSRATADTQRNQFSTSTPQAVRSTPTQPQTQPPRSTWKTIEDSDEDELEEPVRPIPVKALVPVLAKPQSSASSTTVAAPASAPPSSAAKSAGATAATPAPAPAAISTSAAASTSTTGGNPVLTGMSPAARALAAIKAKQALKAAGGSSPASGSSNAARAAISAAAASPASTPAPVARTVHTSTAATSAPSATTPVAAKVPSVASTATPAATASAAATAGASSRLPEEPASLTPAQMITAMLAKRDTAQAQRQQQPKTSVAVASIAISSTTAGRPSTPASLAAPATAFPSASSQPLPKQKKVEVVIPVKSPQKAVTGSAGAPGNVAIPQVAESSRKGKERAVDPVEMPVARSKPTAATGGLNPSRTIVATPVIATPSVPKQQAEVADVAEPMDVDLPDQSRPVPAAVASTSHAETAQTAQMQSAESIHQAAVVPAPVELASLIFPPGEDLVMSVLQQRVEGGAAAGTGASTQAAQIVSTAAASSGSRDLAQAAASTVTAINIPMSSAAAQSSTQNPPNTAAWTESRRMRLRQRESENNPGEESEGQPLISSKERVDFWTGESKTTDGRAAETVDQMLGLDDDDDVTDAERMRRRSERIKGTEQDRPRDAASNATAVSRLRVTEPSAAVLEAFQAISYKKFGDPLLDQINNLGPGFADSPLIRTIMEAYIGRSTMDESGNDIRIALSKGKRNPQYAPPAEFVYSNKMFYGPGVAPPIQSRGCECIGPCKENSDCFCLKRQESYFASIVIEGAAAYKGFSCNSDGTIKDAQYPTFECSDTCGCPPSCQNRVMQRGRPAKLELEIFKTMQKGWGVRTKTFIPSNTFLGIYSGEIIPEKDADVRGKIYTDIGRTYLFDLDHWHIAQPPVDLHLIDPEGAELANEAASELLGTGSDEDDANTSFYTVDAFHWGFSRFINHSCEPNVTLGSVYYDDFDVRKPRLCLTTKCDILPKSELTISYFGEADDPLVSGTTEIRSTPRGKKGKQLSKPHLGSAHNQKGEKKMPSQCYCGSISCRGFMFK